MHKPRKPHSILGAKTRARILWRTARARAQEPRGDSVRVEDIHLSAGERRRVVETAGRMLAGAGASHDGAARERAARLLRTVSRLAELLHRLPE